MQTMNWGHRVVGRIAGVTGGSGIAAIATIAAIAAASMPALARAQEEARVTDYDLPSWIGSDIRAVDADDDTQRFDGNTSIDGNAVVSSSVIVFEGDFFLDGVVEGDVVVINGDLRFGEDGFIDGDAFVVGGAIEGDVSRIGGDATVYSTRAPYDERARLRERDRAREARDRARDRAREARQRERDREREARERERDRERDRDGRDGQWNWDDGNDESDGWNRRRRWRSYDRWYPRTDADFTAQVGPTYNRTEGLPIGLGPRIRVGGSAPFELEALGIWRTATSFDDDDDDVDTDELGYSVRAEQRFGWDAQFFFGGRLYSVVDGIETWGLSDTEAALGTLLFHEDYRDYLERKGWSVHAGFRVPGAGMRFTVDYRDEESIFRPVADPWTVADEEPWRPQPLVAEGDMTSIGGELLFSIPDYYGGWGGGWYLKTSARWGLDGTLVRPAHTADGAVTLSATPFAAENVKYGLIDFRRRTALGWNNRLDIRLLAGGALNDLPLPPQYQHAIGGIGSLPGHDLFIGDCGARDVGSTLIRTAQGRTIQPTFSNYGCDRFALFQAEYRGGIDFDFGWDRGRNRNPDNWDDWDWSQNRFDTSLEWSVFFDAGRGWTLADDDPAVPRFDNETLMDVGLGVWLGGVGLLWAVPLDSEDKDWKFFLRLEHRF